MRRQETKFISRNKMEIIKNENCDPEKEVKDQILISFHNQFSENQNHQQTIFLQFFSAILLSAVPFGIVFTNIDSEAEFWDATRDPQTTNITSYAAIHLIGAWFLIQIALITLSAFTLKIAYSFRRDQKVVEAIRKNFIGETTLYEKLFGQQSFSSKGKEAWGGESYVPLFCAIFWQFAVFLQLMTSLILFLRIQNMTSINDLTLRLWGIGLVALTSIIISYFWRYYYYLKYRLTVEGIKFEALEKESRFKNIFLFLFFRGKKRLQQH